jgi:ATP-dependent helicase HrpB
VRLPIEDVLEEIAARLRAAPNLVVIAPPGAGKTTRVPQVLIDRGVVSGRVLMLEPRRLAARLAAQRIARERKARVGGEVGYQVRFDDRTSKETRIAILTEGILTRRLQSDPTLEGVGAVLLDEFHERSIHADLALAFLREIQETVRPELRIVVMSATLDPAPVRRFLGDCDVVTSEGRLHPVEVRWLERPEDRALVDRTVGAAKRALREVSGGDVLVFLPGAGEIARAAEQLRELESIDVRPLYGELSSEDQDRAIEPGPRRKVILSTNIAESSLTIEGVACVVDAGMAKIARHDPSRGIDVLELVRIGRRSAEQRAGRAGRLGPGVCYRLWSEKEHRTLDDDQAPEIARIDLAPAVLEVVRWAKQDPRAFGWYEAPPAGQLERAVNLLSKLEAIDDRFALSERGERLASFPLHPRLAAILIAAHSAGRLEEGAGLCALASERDVVRNVDPNFVGSCDLLYRLDRMGSGNIRRVQDRLRELGERALGRQKKASGDREEDLRRAVLAGFPDRVGRVRGEEVVLAGGGSARLSRDSVVKSAELVVAVELSGGDRKRGQIPWLRMATAIEPSWLKTTERTSARWNADRLAAEAITIVAYGELVLEEKRATKADPEELTRVLIEAARADLDRALPMTDDLTAILRRLAFLRRNLPELGVELSEDPRSDLLEEVCNGKKSFAELARVDLASILFGRLPQRVQAALQREAPERIAVPSGRTAALRYEVDGPPVLSIRLQEVFGLYETPRVAKGRVPIKMELLAPNQRPVQVTQDLASFWANTYAEVRKELRRRYPKHQWPEDPREGIPSAKTKKNLGK